MHCDSHAACDKEKSLFDLYPKSRSTFEKSWLNKQAINIPYCNIKSTRENSSTVRPLRHKSMELGLASIETYGAIENLLDVLETGDCSLIANLLFSITRVVALSYNHIPPNRWRGRLKTCRMQLQSALLLLKSHGVQNIWMDQIFSARNGWNVPGWTTSAIRPYI